MDKIRKRTPPKELSVGRVRSRRLDKPQPANHDNELDEKSNFDVGYRKPPKHSRFREGQSGNPKGRLKGTKNFSTIARAEMERQLPVTEQGKTTKMSVSQIAVRKLLNDAMMGKPYAIKMAIEIFQRFSEEELGPDKSTELTPAEQDLLNQFLNLPTRKKHKA